jgi:hypothetical protein
MPGARIITVAVKTDAAGDFEREVAIRGQLVAVKVEKGDLSTPDLEITDEPTGTNLLTVAAIAASAIYYPQVATNDPADGTAGDAFVSPVVFGKAKVVVSGAGDTKSGTIRLVFSS